MNRHINISKKALSLMIWIGTIAFVLLMVYLFAFGQFANIKDSF